MYKNSSTISPVQLFCILLHILFFEICARRKEQVASYSERDNETSVFCYENENICTLLKTVS